MKRKIAMMFMLMLFVVMILCGCSGTEVVPVDNTLPVLNPLTNNYLENRHDVEGIEFVTRYDTGKYDLSRWRITDTKTINFYAQAPDSPEGVEIEIAHVHIDMSLKATNPQLDGLAQDSMDDYYHGVGQDGYPADRRYPYENCFVVGGFSKDLTEGWMFACGDYGTGQIQQQRLTEKNLQQSGGVYANKMQVVYQIHIRYSGEEKYHVVTVEDEFLIPVKVEGNVLQQQGSQK